jgi:hypothetical protein
MRKTFLALLLSGVLTPAMVRAETTDAGTPDGPPASHSTHALADNDDSDSSANMPPPSSKDAAHERQSVPPESGTQGADGSNKTDSDKSDSDKSTRKNIAPPAEDPSRTPATSGPQGGSNGIP